MALDQNLKKKENINYHKANTALQYLKNGCVPSLERILRRQHVRIISDIQRKMNITKSSDLASCHCSLETLQPAHANVRGKCTFDPKRRCYCQNPRGRERCPAGFCGNMHDKLIAQHRYFKPNFKNTNIKEWRTSPLQIGLCNIGSNNKADIKSLEDMDPAAILQILINDMEVTSDPSDPYLLVLLKKVKRCRDEFTHSGNMALADSKLLQLIDDIIESLDRLPRCDESDEAKRLTLKLKDEEWEITSKGAGKCQPNSAEKHLKEKIETCRSTVIKEMRSRENDADPTISSFLHRMDDSLQQIAHAVDKTDKTQLAKYSLSFRLTDLEKKLALREFLLKKYQRNLLEIEDGITVDEIYVPQKTMVKDEHEKGPRRMTTYKDMFYHRERKAKNIYIISKEGGGKSVFLKHLTSIWCRVHTGDALQDSLSEIETIMLQYDFLFYVSLYYEKRERDVHNIIISQLLEDNSHIEVFEQLMTSESGKCLIILDALNEFILVGDGRENIPVCDETKDYTVVMTTRHWKTEMIMKTDKIIEISGIMSPFTFVRKAVNSLNKRYTRDKDFMDFLVKFGVLRCQQSMPSVLMLHIRLWFNGNDE